MDVDEAIRTRRSVRRYRPTRVPDDLLRQIVEAGIAAPSAGNLQSRRFFVVKDTRRRGRLAAAAMNQQFIREAPVAVVVCADHRIRNEYEQRGVDLYCLLDCAAATHSMMLAAHARGLATCWVGAFDEAEVARILDTPRYLRPVTIFPIGYPAETPTPPSRIRFETACKFI